LPGFAFFPPAFTSAAGAAFPPPATAATAAGATAPVEVPEATAGATFAAVEVEPAAGLAAVPVEAAAPAAELSAPVEAPPPAGALLAALSPVELCELLLWDAVSAPTREPPQAASNASAVRDAVAAVTKRRGLVLADICLPFGRPRSGPR
jgi:hypothetical protein